MFIFLFFGSGYVLPAGRGARPGEGTPGTMNILPPFPPAQWRHHAGQHQRYPAPLTLPKTASEGRKYQHVVLSLPISQKPEEQLASSKDAVALWVSLRCHQSSPGNHMARWPVVSPGGKGNFLVGAGLSNSSLKCEKREKRGVDGKKGTRKNERGEILRKN